MLIRTVRYLILVMAGLVLATSPGCLPKTQRPAFYVIGASTIGKFDPVNGIPTTWKEDPTHHLRGPALSPDGQWVGYFRCVLDEACDLWVAEANGQEERFLAGPFLPLLYAPPRSLQWSSDGRYIAFRAAMAESQKKQGVYILSADTGNIVHSLVGGNHLAWAPSSPRVALIWQDRDPPTENGLYIFDVENGEEDFVLQNHTERMLTEVAWLGDEEHVLIVARSTVSSSTYRVYLVNVNDGSLEEIPVRDDTSNNRDIYSLQVAPAGQRLAFLFRYASCDGDCRDDVVVINLDTHDEQWIETPVGSDLVWSPNGKCILFECAGPLEPPGKICLVSPDDGKVSEVVTSEDQPIWSLSW